MAIPSKTPKPKGSVACPSLDDLTAEFDQLFVGLQSPKAERALESTFRASPAELGKAAVAAARKTKVR